MKICKNGKFQHIRLFSTRKKFSLKIGLGHILRIANIIHIFVQKKSKKLDEILSKFAKRFFWHISSIFGWKNVFPKSGSVTF